MASEVLADRTSWTLKVSFGGEYRRVRCWPGDGIEPTAELAHATACSLFDLSEELCLTFEGESGVCTLTEATLSHALRLAASSGILRFSASSVEPRTQGRDVSFGTSATVDPSQAVPESSEPSVDAPQDLADSTEALPPAEQSQPPQAEPVISQGGEQSQPPQAEPGISPGGYLCISERLSNVRPRIQDGISHLKQQISHDYQVNCEDMKNAFGAARSGANDPADNGRASNVQAVAGTIAGALAAGSLIPLRCTKLVAQSVAGVAATSQPTHQEDQGARQSSVDTPIATEAQNSGFEDFGGDLAHFKNQVAQDFENTRQEMQSAFACLTGRDATSTTGTHPAQVIPAVASTIAGLRVATAMLPLRAARLAVARVAS